MKKQSISCVIWIIIALFLLAGCGDDTINYYYGASLAAPTVDASPGDNGNDDENPDGAVPCATNRNCNDDQVCDRQDHICVARGSSNGGDGDSNGGNEEDAGAPSPDASDDENPDNNGDEDASTDDPDDDPDIYPDVRDDQFFIQFKLKKGVPSLRGIDVFGEATDSSNNTAHGWDPPLCATDPEPGKGVVKLEEDGLVYTCVLSRWTNDQILKTNTIVWGTSASEFPSHDPEKQWGCYGEGFCNSEGCLRDYFEYYVVDGVDLTGSCQYNGDHGGDYYATVDGYDP